MILIQTPLRVSLFGGGTDYPQWFTQHGGCVVGMAINKYCYTSLLRPIKIYQWKYRICYSIIEQCDGVEKIAHPAVRAVLQKFNINEQLEIRHATDVPSRSGLGSSSSFVVGLVHATQSLIGDEITTNNLAALATHIEQDVIKESVGNQDQIFAAHGGLLRIDFHKNNAPTIIKLKVSPDRITQLEQNLVLVYTGMLRDAHIMAAQQLAEQYKHENELKKLEILARNASVLLCNEKESLDVLGPMLHESWLQKKRLANGVANAEIDVLYEHCLSIGATGGKLLGAGGGGFILCYVPDDNQHKFFSNIGAPYVKIRVSLTGSRRLLNQP